MYKKALTYWVLGGFEAIKSAKEAIDDTARFGLEALELTFGDVLKQDITEKECKDILHYAKSKKVELLTLTTGAYWNCSLSSEDEKERQAAVVFTKKYINVARWLEVKIILVVSGAVDVGWDSGRPITPYQKVWDISTKSLKEILPYAEQHGITIALENVWNKFLLSPIELKIYIDQFNSNFIGSYFDAGNVIASGYPEHWLDILQYRIKAVQVKNFKRQDAGGTILGFTDDLLQGDLDYDNLKKALQKINYQGPITAEMIPFCRLPNMVLPDMKLAEDSADKLKQLF